MSGIILLSALVLTQSNLWGFQKKCEPLNELKNCAYYNIVIHRLMTISFVSDKIVQLGKSRYSGCVFVLNKFVLD